MRINFLLHVKYFLHLNFFEENYINWFMSLSDKRKLYIIENEWTPRDRNDVRRFLKKIKKFEDALSNNRLKVYQEICFFVFGVRPISITDCRAMFQNVFVNIYDYLNRDQFDKSEIIFETKRDLFLRCEKVGFFPRKQAKLKNFKLLLKQLFQ